MLVIPAIDIRAGKVVRLFQGKYEEETVYSHDPVDIAKNWQDKGAMFIHIVDLDGALMGELKNIEVVEEIVKSITIPVELGGGIRKIDDINIVLDKGVSRVVLGTMAFRDEQFIKEAVSEFNEKIVISIDAKDEKVATDGWRTTEQVLATELAKKIEKLNPGGIIYTDISRDGTLTGPNIDGITQMLAATNIPLIASGGVSCLEDIESLKSLKAERLVGVIVGKALYEGKIDLAQAIELVK